MLPLSNANLMYSGSNHFATIPPAHRAHSSSQPSKGFLGVVGTVTPYGQHPALEAPPSNLGIVLGYVRGISGLFGSPSIVRIGGTTNIVTGPKLPMTMEQKMAGFSIAAHRRYRKGCEKNRGQADIVSGRISIDLQLPVMSTYPIDNLKPPFQSLVLLQDRRATWQISGCLNVQVEVGARRLSRVGHLLQPHPCSIDVLALHRCSFKLQDAQVLKKFLEQRQRNAVVTFFSPAGASVRGACSELQWK